jgi:hypothetical protein
MRVRSWLIAAGVVACAAVLVGALRWPQAAMTGWLAGAAAFACIPAGALVLVMMMRLIPGAWGESLRLACEAAILLTPLAALAFVPLLLGLGAVYPWIHRPPTSAFAAAWLSPWGYVLRSVLWFAMTGALDWAMLARRSTKMAAAIGVVVTPLFAHLIAVDWLMSRDPAFASSAFGLQFLSIAVTAAFCAAVLLRHAAGARPFRSGVLGALLLTLLLIWSYLDFMAYLIVWSGNLPDSVGWYQARAHSGWEVALGLMSVLGGLPLFLLLFAPIRKSPRWLAVLCASVLLSKLVEIVWLAVPPLGSAAALFAVAAVGGFCLLGAGFLPLALAVRVRSRTS